MQEKNTPKTRDKQRPVPARKLSEEDIAYLAEQGLRGPVPLEELFNQAVFGGPPPRAWRRWPQHARDDWDAAARAYFRLYESEREEREARAEAIDLLRAWEAVEASMESDDTWTRLSWSDIAYRLGVTERQVTHVLRDTLGFQVRGQPHERELIQAPCLVCGEVFDLEDEQQRLCPLCLAALKDVAESDGEARLTPEDDAGANDEA